MDRSNLYFDRSAHFGRDAAEVPRHDLNAPTDPVARLIREEFLEILQDPQFQAYEGQLQASLGDRPTHFRVFDNTLYFSRDGSNWATFEERAWTDAFLQRMHHHCHMIMELANLRDENTALRTRLITREEELADKDAEIQLLRQNLHRERTRNEELQAQLGELNSTVATLRTEKEQLEREKRDQAARIAALEHELEIITAERDRLRRENQEELPRLRQELSSLQVSYEEAQHALQLERDSHTRTRESLEAALRRVHELETNLHQLNGRIRLLEQENLDLRSQLERANEILVRTRADLTSRISHLEEENQTLTHQNRESDHTISDLRHQLALLERRNEQLTEQIALLDETITTKNRQLEDSERARRVALDSVDRLTRERDALRAAARETEDIIGQLRHNNQAQETALRDLRQVLEGLTRENASLHEQLDARPTQENLDQLRDTLQAQIEERDATIATLQAQNGEQGQTLAHNRETLEALTRERDALRDAARETENAIGQLRNDNQAQETALRDLRQVLERLTRENASLSEQLAARPTQENLDQLRDTLLAQIRQRDATIATLQAQNGEQGQTLTRNREALEALTSERDALRDAARETENAIGQLRNDNQAQERALTELRQVVDRLTPENATLREQLDARPTQENLDQLRDTLQAQIRQRDTAIATLQAQNGEQGQTLTRNREALEALTRERNDLAAAATETENAIGQLRRDNQAQERTISELGEARDALQRALDQSGVEAQDLRQELSRVRAELEYRPTPEAVSQLQERLEGINRELRERVASLENELSSVTRDRDTLRALSNQQEQELLRLRDLANSVSELQQEFNEDDLAGIRQGMRNLQDEVHRLRGVDRELLRLRDELNHVQSDASHLGSQLEEMVESVNQINRQLELANLVMGDQNQEIHALRRELELGNIESEEAQRRLQGIIDDLHERLTNASEENRTKERVIHASSEALDRLVQERDRAESVVDQQTRRVALQEEVISTLRAHQERLEDDLREKEEALESAEATVERLRTQLFGEGVEENLPLRELREEYDLPEGAGILAILQAQRDRIAEMGTEDERKSALLEEAERHIDTLSQALRHKRVDLDLALANIQNLVARLRSANLEHESIQRQMHQFMEVASRLLNEEIEKNHRLREGLESATGANQRQQTLIEEQHQALERVHQGMERIKEMLGSGNQDFSFEELASKISELKEDHQRLREDHEHLIEALRESEERVRELSLAVDAKGRENSSLKLEKERQDALVRELKAGIELLRQTHILDERELAKRQQELDRLMQERNAMKLGMREVKNELDAMRELFQQHLDQAMSLLGQKVEENKAQKDELTLLRRERDDLVRELEELRAQVAQDGARLSNQDSMIARMQQHNEELHRLNQTQQEEIARLVDAKRIIERELEKVNKQHEMRIRKLKKDVIKIVGSNPFLGETSLEDALKRLISSHKELEGRLAGKQDELNSLIEQHQKRIEDLEGHYRQVLENLNEVLERERAQNISLQEEIREFNEAIEALAKLDAPLAAETFHTSKAHSPKVRSVRHKIEGLMRQKEEAAKATRAIERILEEKERRIHALERELEGARQLLTALQEKDTKAFNQVIQELDSLFLEGQTYLLYKGRPEKNTPLLIQELGEKARAYRDEAALLRQQHREKEETIARLEENIQRGNTLLSDAERKNGQLRDQIKRLDEEKVALQRKLEAIRKAIHAPNIDNLEQDMQAYRDRAHFEEKRSLLESLRKISPEYSSDTDFDGLIARVARDVSIYKNDNHHLQEEINRLRLLERENQERQLQLQTHQEEMEREIGSLSYDNNLLKVQIARIRVEYAALEKDLDAAKLELGQVKEEKENALRQKGEREEQVQALEQKHLEDSRAIDRLTRELSSLENTSEEVIARLERQIQKLESDVALLTASNQEKERLKTKIASLEKEVQDLRHRNQENESLGERISDLQKELRELKGSNEAKDIQIQELEEALSNMAAEKEILLRRIEALETENRDLRGRTVDLTNRLKGQIDDERTRILSAVASSDDLPATTIDSLPEAADALRRIVARVMQQTQEAGEKKDPIQIPREQMPSFLLNQGLLTGKIRVERKGDEIVFLFDKDFVDHSPIDKTNLIEENGLYHYTYPNKSRGTPTPLKNALDKMASTLRIYTDPTQKSKIEGNNQHLVTYLNSMIAAVNQNLDNYEKSAQRRQELGERQIAILEELARLEEGGKLASSDRIAVLEEQMRQIDDLIARSQDIENPQKLQNDKLALGRQVAALRREAERHIQELGDELEELQADMQTLEDSLSQHEQVGSVIARHTREKWPKIGVHVVVLKMVLNKPQERALKDAVDTISELLGEVLKDVEVQEASFAGSRSSSPSSSSSISSSSVSPRPGSVIRRSVSPGEVVKTAAAGASLPSTLRRKR